MTTLLRRAGTQDVIRFVNLARTPRRAVARSRIAAEIAPPYRLRDGYWTFGPNDIPGAAEVVAACRALFDSRGREYPDSNKPFLRRVIEGAAFQETDLFRFMIRRDILDTAAAYLGSAPLLHDARLMWSPPNETAERSQRYHCDSVDRTQVKIFINIFDTDESCGPLTFIPATASEAVRNRIGYAMGAKLDDDLFDGSDAVRLIGPPGSGGMVDTSRCFHYGSRGNLRDRLVLMFHFVRYGAPKARPVAWRPMDGLDRIQRLALGFD